MLDQFKSEPDAWFDDVLIGKMIGLAKETGDVTRNPVILPEMTFDQSNFWTSHFGGLYVFRGVEHPAAISAADRTKLGEVPIQYLMDFRDRAAIAKFFQLNDLVEPVAKARGIDAAAILHQKMDFIVAEVAAEMGEDLRGRHGEICAGLDGGMRNNCQRNGKVWRLWRVGRKRTALGRAFHRITQPISIRYGHRTIRTLIW